MGLLNELIRAVFALIKIGLVAFAFMVPYPMQSIVLLLAAIFLQLMSIERQLMELGTSFRDVKYLAAIKRMLLEAKRRF